MVKIILKGLKKDSDHNGRNYNHTFKIAEFRAGVILLEDGGIQIGLSSKPLSKALKVFFDEIWKKKNHM